MHLYEVIRWGNPSDDPHTGGPNGHDTCFLVRAASLEAAAALADGELRFVAGAGLADWAEVAYLLGDDTGTDGTARVLRGPYIQSAYRHGWRQWNRAGPGEPWIESARG
ncbi:hypothetical protein [Lysobacter solisilvae (ex Woo and Kim 2020)]|uniref:Uncharacterized protein n=1 Tax=Agrilutibacter terrestris TaxID=2865112 RepID=A0A7H0G0A3_9GAMM|nr:hypothetical protein [Lysobacter terrestris]QNP41719.1 hypothetical protein H8B22_05790 [Lysobacter terrestris]